MKAKHLLFTVAIGATFAACTSEDNFNIAENNATDAKLSIRPVVDVEITLPGDEVNTRLGLGTGARPVWSTNDKLGAAVIDMPKYTSQNDYATKLASAGGKAIALYDVIESYGCNNAFSTTDGGKTWAAEQPMVEGNYLFYAPYQVGLNFRSPLEVAVPRIQDASGEKTALGEFYNGDNIVQVGYKFITGTEKQRPVVPMFNIFAYPKFTIKNDFNGYLFESGLANAVPTKPYNGTIKVDSIEFVNISAKGTAKTGMVIGGKLKHSSASAKVANDASNDISTTPASVIAALHQENNGFNTDGAWNDLDYMLGAKTTEFVDNSADKVMTGRHTSSIHNMDGVITTLVVGKELAQGASMDIFAVMPAYAFNYTNDMLAAKIYVTIEDAQYVICEGKLKTGSALNANATEGYTFTARKNAGLTSLTFMAGQSLPAEALYVDGNTYKKKDKGEDLFTIDLKGGTSTSADEVQIALLTSATAEEGIKSTDELIDMIKKDAPNGTNWVEGTTSDATQKGYTIAPTNTIEINSALIDCLANYNQNTGGALSIKTVVPIANDVKVTATTATSVTLESVSGKSYTIGLPDAVAQNAAAADKYVIVKGNQTQSAAIAGAVVIVDGATWTVDTADPGVKSLHIASTASSAVTTALTTITADNIRNDGELTAVGITANAIVNEGTMTVTGTLDASSGTLSLTNNGTIAANAGAASFTVTAGTGTVTTPEATTSLGISIAPAATQDVIYVCTTTLETAQITAAAAIPSVNVIKANGKTTLKADDIAKFNTIKRIQITTGGIDTKDVATYNMTGFKVELLGAATWTGTSAVQTKVTGVKVVLGAYDLTLANIAASGSSEATTGKIKANGVTATWNGGASN